MGTLIKRIKESTLGRVFSEVGIALDELINEGIGYDDNQTVKEAIEETKRAYPGVADLDKIGRISEANDKVLNEMAERFDDQKYFNENLSEVDEDGYHKIEDKLKDIKAEVSGTKPANRSARNQGGKSKTRVDES